MRLDTGTAQAAIDAPRADAAVQEMMRVGEIPGAAVALVYGDAHYVQGYGVREKGKDDPITPETLFANASTTKAFTTTAMALLVDEGKMSWDDHVRKHLSYFRLSDPLADREVRLRDLVTHRTGLASHDMLWYHAAWPPEEAVRRAGRLPLDHPFRTAFQYQTSMFTAAGLAVASTAKMPWDRFIEKRLFVPLGMTTAGCTTNTIKTEDRASGHRLNGRGEVEPLAEWYPLTEPEPAGSIHASARDLAQWL